MLILPKKQCVFYICCASLCWNISAARIHLCSSSKNGTLVPAILGAPISVSFCVQSDYEVYKYVYISIEPRRTGSGWYPLPQEQNIKLHAGIKAQGDHMATVNITINHVEQEDFSQVFSVRAKTVEPDNDNVTFIFQLTPEALTTSDVWTHVMTSTPVTTRQTYTPDVTTHGKPGCPTRKSSECPERWYPAENKMCLTVISGNALVFPEKQCEVHDALLPAETDIINMKSCLIHLLANTSVKVIPLKYTYLNVASWTRVNRSARGYSVACLREQQPKNAATITDETDPIYIWPPLVVLTVVGFAIFGVLIYKKKAKRMRTDSSRVLSTSEDASEHIDKVMYANLKDLENDYAARESQAVPDKETSIKNYEVNECHPDITDQDCGHTMSEEGLVYTTIAHTLDRDSKKPHLAKQKPKRKKLPPKETSGNPGDSVEYMTLNYDKTGQVTTIEGEEKSEDKEIMAETGGTP